MPVRGGRSHPPRRTRGSWWTTRLRAGWRSPWWSWRGGSLAGTATLWGIDNHNRSAHIGLGLLPEARGKGYGTDVVATLCHYGFVVRGLQRLQIETLADNHAMLRAAERNGFVREGVLRSSAWVLGEFLDEVLLGLLVQEWKPDARG